ncbi:MAG: NAD-dependent epimerase/dehydratase family protein [Halarchaeum sp.]
MDDIGPRDLTVAVTGGAGFIGGHLVAALAPHNDVTVLDDFSSGARERVPDDVRTVEGDVRDSDAVAPAIDIETVAARPGDVKHSRADVSAARDLLGYEPTVDLPAGIRTVV